MRRERHPVLPLFDRLFRSAADRSADGTGLGSASAKRTVDERRTIVSSQQSAIDQMKAKLAALDR